VVLLSCLLLRTENFSGALGHMLLCLYLSSLFLFFCLYFFCCPDCIFVVGHSNFFVCRYVYIYDLIYLQDFLCLLWYSSFYCFSVFEALGYMLGMWFHSSFTTLIWCLCCRINLGMAFSLVICEVCSHF
jgi:hypothetical protein